MKEPIERLRAWCKTESQYLPIEPIRAEIDRQDTTITALGLRLKEAEALLIQARRFLELGSETERKIRTFLLPQYLLATINQSETKDQLTELLALINERKTWADPSVEVKEWWPRVLAAVNTGKT